MSLHQSSAFSDALHRSQQLPCKPNSESDLFRVAHSELLRGTLIADECSNQDLLNKVSPEKALGYAGGYTKG